MSKGKKSPDQVALERKARWLRYGIIGQARYGNAALNRIISDTCTPNHIRAEAIEIQSNYNNLMKLYKEYLNDKC